MGKKMTLGELCPDLSKLRTSASHIDQETQQNFEFLAYRVRKIGGDLSALTQKAYGLIMSKKNYFVTVSGHVTEILEVAHSGRLVGQIISGRMKRGCAVLYSRGGTIFPVTWNNYKQIWSELTYAPVHEQDDRIRRPERTSAEIMFADAQQDNVRRKKSSGGKRLPRPHEIQPALTETHTQTITLYI